MLPGRADAWDLQRVNPLTNNFKQHAIVHMLGPLSTGTQYCRECHEFEPNPKHSWSDLRKIESGGTGRSRVLCNLIHHRKVIGHRRPNSVRMVRSKSLAEYEQARGAASLLYARVSNHLLSFSGVVGVNYKESCSTEASQTRRLMKIQGAISRTISQRVRPSNLISIPR
jgi:hypothetical protein